MFSASTLEAVFALFARLAHSLVDDVRVLVCLCVIVYDTSQLFIALKMHIIAMIINKLIM